MKNMKKRKGKNKNMLGEYVYGISWEWQEVVHLELECVKDASTSPPEETACGSFGITFCKCWACNLSHIALLLIAMRSVVRLLCVI